MFPNPLLASLPSESFVWVGILVCLAHSAMFSGLNLAFFTVGWLRLEAEAEIGNKEALRILRLRKDSNFLLCTILWGNVSVNVLLALLSESVLTGGLAFLVSTVGITFIGEIVPQAYFSRHAMRMGALLSPLVRVYQFILFPVAKPSAMILDNWIGPEGPSFLRERNMEVFLQRHIHDEESDIGAVEGRGALNFLSLDDRKMATEGTEIAPESVLSFPIGEEGPEIPGAGEVGWEAFIEELQRISYKWTIITDKESAPQLVLDTNRYLREVLGGNEAVEISAFCHRPVVVDDPGLPLESVLDKMVVEAENSQDRIVDRDVILLWTDGHRRIVAGADVLGRLLQGIAQREPAEGMLPGSENSPVGVRLASHKDVKRRS